MKSIVLSFLFSLVTTAVAFTPALIQRKYDGVTTVVGKPVPTHLFAGGFGGAGGEKSPKKKGKTATSKESKLKPKQQWDRYQDMKGEPKIRVAIRCKEDESEEWLEVGRVKSKENEYTVVAVARQRALIAEHAKRLYPLQVSNKKTIEWAYFQDETEEWATVDKEILEEQTLPDGLDKVIGFEGRADPASGFYCVYDNGRLATGPSP